MQVSASESINNEEEMPNAFSGQIDGATGPAKENGDVFISQLRDLIIYNGHVFIIPIL